MLGSIDDELTLAMLLSGWAKPAVRKVGPGSMSSHSSAARKKRNSYIVMRIERFDIALKHNLFQSKAYKSTFSFENVTIRFY